ncbi:hypothetical protein CPC08DRAFT_823599 [Agrocybe pediades]|nr:hypothetical protein CPC08DRAFT_823599 [Agrocybe pediades]
MSVSTLCSSSSPIEELSDDVLVSIFMLNTLGDEDFEGTSSNSNCTSLITLRNTSQVCTLWRNMPLTAPLLWANSLCIEHLNQQDNAWREEVMRRTQSVPISVDGRFVDSGQVSDFFMDLLDRNWHRIRRLYADMQIPLEEDPRWVALQKPAPLLEVLSLTFPVSPTTLRGTPVSLFSDTVPRIRAGCTSLRGMGFVFTIPGYSWMLRQVHHPFITGAEELCVYSNDEGDLPVFNTEEEEEEAATTCQPHKASTTVHLCTARHGDHVGFSESHTCWTRMVYLEKSGNLSNPELFFASLAALPSAAGLEEVKSVDINVIWFALEELDTFHELLGQFFYALKGVTSVRVNVNSALRILMKVQANHEGKLILPRLESLAFVMYEELDTETLMRFILQHRDSGHPIRLIDLTEYEGPHRDRLLFLNGIDALTVNW